MFLRSILSVLACSIQMSSAGAAVVPYRVSLVGDGLHDGTWHTGVLIELDDGWKTYWRMPGEAGIPPDFSWKTSDPADIQVLFPAPGRFEDASGETVGYQHKVLLPVKVKAGTVSELKVELQLFFAVCKDICIPARSEAAITLGSAVKHPQDAARVEVALAAIPQQGNIVSNARIAVHDGKPALELALSAPLDDIFVETATTAYFRAPVFSQDGLTAYLPVDNVKDVSKLSGTALQLTYVKDGVGLEQSLRLP
jgi:DsbC/DsbD-like thiol-disulfide interchange protein